MGFNGSSRVAPGGPAKSFGKFFSRRGIFLCFGGIFFFKSRPGRLGEKKFFFWTRDFLASTRPGSQNIKNLGPDEKNAVA